MYKSLGERTLGTVGPHTVGYGEVGSKAEPVAAAKFLECISLYDREKASIYSKHIVLAKLLGKPLGDGSLAGNILLVEVNARVFELLCSLEEVARVGPQSGIVESNHGSAVASGETGDPVAEFPVVAYIFTLVIVSAGNNHCTHLHAAHLVAQSFKIFQC